MSGINMAAMLADLATLSATYSDEPHNTDNRIAIINGTDVSATGPKGNGFDI